MKPGPTPDPESQHRGTVTLGDVAGVLVATTTEVPAPPAGLGDELLDEWAVLWASKLRLVIADTSVPTLRRLWLLRQESADAHLDCVETPMVQGSQGPDQEVLNPRCRQAIEVDKEIRQLEDRFGLNPQAYGKLGLLALAAEQAGRRGGPGDGPAPTPRPDPRA